MIEAPRRYSAVTGFSLIATPYWTDADQAELDVLIWEFITRAERHRGCPDCERNEEIYGHAWCEQLSAGLEVVLDWRRSRSLRSRATWLRAQQDAGDWLRELERERAAA